MELKKAAEILGVSTRHLHRMIKSNTLPATKKTIVVQLSKNVWDVDDKTIVIAQALLWSFESSEVEFRLWLKKRIAERDISLSQLAQMSKIRKRTLQRIINNQKVRMLPQDYQLSIISALARSSLKSEYQP